jgi:hypothetical protein
MTQVEVPLTDAEMAALQRLARKRQVSVVELIKEGVAGLLQRPPERPDDEVRRRALAVAGRFRSGDRDLARNHDDYLAEAFGD